MNAFTYNKIVFGLHRSVMINMCPKTSSGVYFSSITLPSPTFRFIPQETFYEKTSSY